MWIWHGWNTQPNLFDLDVRIDRGRHRFPSALALSVLEPGVQGGSWQIWRQGYIDLLRQGIRFDVKLLQDSLARLRAKL